MNLYEVIAEIELIYLNVDEDGMLTDEAMEQLQNLAIDEQSMVEGVACKIKNLNAEAKALREEEKALAERRKSKENAAEKSKAYLQNVLILKGLKKYETPRAVVSLRNSEAVSIDDDSLIPEDYKTYEPKISKTQIKEAIKAGREVPGAKIVANQSLQIK